MLNNPPQPGSRLADILRHRALLSAQAEAQRDCLSAQLAHLDKRLKMANTALSAFSILKSPLVLASLAAVLIKFRWLKPSRIARWAWQGWKAFAFINRIRK